LCTSNQHLDSVAEAAVVGVNDELTGQAVNAFVALKEGFDHSEQIKKDLILQVRKSIGPFAAPKAIFTVDDLPKTRSGKIMRRILRKILAGEEDQLGDTSTVSALQPGSRGGPRGGMRGLGMKTNFTVCSSLIQAWLTRSSIPSTSLVSNRVRGCRSRELGAGPTDSAGPWALALGLGVIYCVRVWCGECLDEPVRSVSRRAAKARRWRSLVNVLLCEFGCDDGLCWTRRLLLLYHRS
jgi:hypothetical protein